MEIRHLIIHDFEHLEKYFIESFFYQNFVSQILNNGILLVIIGLMVVGGIGVFSIYLQADKAIAEIKNVVEPNYHCLAEYDEFYYPLEADPQLKFNKEIREMGIKFLHGGCYSTFREWMPESHSGWDQMIVKENNRTNTCENYLAGEGVFTELDIESLRLWECEDFLRK